MHEQAVAKLLISPAETAEMLDVSARTLQRMQQAGEFGPMPVKIARSQKFRADDVRQWVLEGCPSRADWLAKME